MEKLLAELSKLGIKLWLEGDEIRITSPRGMLTDSLKSELQSNKGQIIELLRAQQHLPDNSWQLLKSDSANRYEPFPLTDLQHAFWLGRNSKLEMGDIATHLYVELDCVDLQLSRLNNALCALIDRHDMLRAIVDNNGQQRVLPKVPRYEINADDKRSASLVEIDAAIEAARNDLSHQVRKTDQWPLFEIRATLLPAERVRLHVSLDLLILDAYSISQFFREWHQLYEHPEKTLPPLGITFRDYVFADKQNQQGDAYRRAQAYWIERVEKLPPAPDLPIRTDPTARKSPRFTRREARMDKDRWSKLKVMARERGLTPSALLLAAYAEVLALWSTTPHFTLNLTISNRRLVHQDVNHILGDFTSLIMQEVDRRDTGVTFTNSALRLQQQFLINIEHSQFSGVLVLREWAKWFGAPLHATMPVVFTSGLIWSGDNEASDLEEFGTKAYAVSQTSQVWLDHHVMEVKGELVLTWDAADAVFEEGVLNAMFDSYCQLVERLAVDESVWDETNPVLLPTAMRSLREETNRTTTPWPEQHLHAGFVAQALRNPKSIAIESSARSMTYGELLGESTAIADWLIENGVKPGEPVGVVMRKGWEQIVAVFGILLAGCAYMPIDNDWPTKRKMDLLRIGDVRFVLTQPGSLRQEIDNGEWGVREVVPGITAPYLLAHAKSLTRSLDNMAYVIFTSGTTGMPKGVMISHRGAANTIHAINRTFQVNSNDRVIALSSLSFDLSAYDVFGVLNAGGALVLPDYAKRQDPKHWRELMNRYQVTLWNTAPQLMRILMDSYQLGEAGTAPLRLVLLSGDFVPLDLPGVVSSHYKHANVVSLGGATEASIWSIYYLANALTPAWTSIPYGRPLPNQTTWVYDHALRPCPDYVKGRIYIGGTGLAIGYWRDPEKTSSRFIVHPKTGERLYDTGDLGCYAPDGNIIILGRVDGQVKIRGHRVELSEIEWLLNQHASVKRTIVVAAEGTGSRQLVAYIQPDSTSDNTDLQQLKQYLAEQLPDYMVPRHFVLINDIPVSANGKIDHRALPPVQGVNTTNDRVLPRNAVEQAIFNVWTRVIVGLDIGVTDNFFELGGDSILATQLVRELNAALPFELEIHELFENLTIESLATLYQHRISNAQVDFAKFTDSPSSSRLLAKTDVLQSDIRAAESIFAKLQVPPVSTRKTPPETILLTGATGWVGSHILHELLTATNARIFCLVRATNVEEATQRLKTQWQQYGLTIDESVLDRVQPICGDLTKPNFDLSAEQWKLLGEKVDAIYHFAATVNLLIDYATHRATNITPLATCTELAVQHHLKPIVTASPMVVCRRRINRRLAVFAMEQPHSDPSGLVSAYAQSKWVAEQILQAANKRGVPIKIYRTSHALPSSRTGIGKANDTYNRVLQIARLVNSIPIWSESSLYGVPVDIFSRLVIEDSLTSADDQLVVHVENRTPFSVQQVIELLMSNKHPLRETVPYVPLNDWKRQCLAATETLPKDEVALPKLLFGARATGSVMENMFTRHSVGTTYFERYEQESKLNELTPANYWRKVFDVSKQYLQPATGRSL